MPAMSKGFQQASDSRGVCRNPLAIPRRIVHVPLVPAVDIEFLPAQNRVQVRECLGDHAIGGDGEVFGSVEGGQLFGGEFHNGLIGGGAAGALII